MIRSTLILLLSLFGTGLALAFPVPDASNASRSGVAFAMMQESEEREPGPADLDEAIEIAEKHFGGRAVGSETVERDGQLVHEIRLFNEADGTARTVRIDPDTGEIIPPRRR